MILQSIKCSGILFALALAFAAAPTQAQVQMQVIELNPAATSSTKTTAATDWTDHNDSDPSVTAAGDPDKPVVVGTVPNDKDEGGDENGSTASQQGRVILDSDVNEQTDTRPGERINRPDFGSGTQDGEQVAPSQTPVIVTPAATKEPEESSEKAGTEDINIGVGELHETQNNESDLDFLRERADVSISRVDVRGWDPKTKEAVLGDAKEPGEVRSDEDLQQFAAGVLLKHESIDLIKTSTTSITLEQQVPAKLFGIFNTQITQATTVQFGDGRQGRVKVQFPWHRFLFKVDEQHTQTGMEQTFLPEVNDEVLTAFETGDPSSPSTQATILQRLVDAVMK